MISDLPIPTPALLAIPVGVVVLILVVVILRNAGIGKKNAFFETAADHKRVTDDDLDSDDALAVEDQAVATSAGDSAAVGDDTLRDGLSDEFDDASDTETRVVDDPAERQLAPLAPTIIEEDPDHHEFLRVDEDYCRAYFIDGWPEQMSDGGLEDIFAEPALDFDVSIHVNPIDTTAALADLKEQIRDLESDRELLVDDGQIVEARDVERKVSDHRAMRDAIRDTDAEMVDVSMYVTVAADDTQELDRVSDALEDKLNKAGLEPILKTKDQERAFRSTSPIAKDELDKKASMMGGAVGAMMPFSSGTLIQEEGIPIGEHAHNQSPIIYDRFTHDQGYNMLTIGNIGSGKSFATGLQLLRRRLYDPDCLIIMLDPLQGFAGICNALNGQHVPVGADFGLNPMEIKEPPEEVKDNPEVDPGSAKMKDLKAFWESFFQMRGGEEGLGERWTTLQRAIRIAYEQRGINLDDPDTYGGPNPTIRDDVVPILLEMVTDVEDHTIITDIVDEEHIEEVLDAAREVTKKERHRAAELLLAMEPFLEGGALSNLGRESEFNIQNEEVIWLDLQQQESRGGLGLMMNLLFSAVYERAKETDKRIIFAIDEARYIMRDKAALEFLEQAVRHSRHYDLSIQFITQTVDEFFQHPEAKAIADQCAHKLFFHIGGLDDELREKVDLNKTEANFVRTATPGDEDRGYSEAAFGVQGQGWYPVHIRANNLEAAVVDLDPDQSIRAALPGMDETEAVPEQIQLVRERLLDKYGEDAEIEVSPAQVVPEVRVPSDDPEKDYEYIVDRNVLQESGPDLTEMVAEELNLDATSDAVASENGVDEDSVYAPFRGETEE